MILPHKIKKIAFDSYKELIEYSKKRFINLEYKGLAHEELVNEAIITILDVKNGFENKETVLKFIKKSIETIGFHEMNILKDYNFILKPSINNETSKPLLDVGYMPPPIDTPTDGFIRIYEIFERQRFGADNEKRICNNCSSTSFYSVRGNQSKCKVCGYILSMTSGTYLNNMRISVSKYYKLLTWICKPYKTSTFFLARLCGLTQKTSWTKRKLILSVIKQNASFSTDQILDKLLTSKRHDDEPIVLIDTSYKNRKFDINDIYNIRRLYTEKIYNSPEIAEMYNTDASSIRKIGKKLLYKAF